MDETKKTGIGSTLATIIIIALIVLGGLYFWGKRLEESKNIKQITNETVIPPVTMTAEQQEAAVIKSTSPSDEINAIEADLQNTNLNNLDSELQTTVQPQ